MEREITVEDVRAAAARIEGHVVKTPMAKSRTLSELIGAEVWLKFENYQFTAAYKERGALNKLCQLTEEEKKRGVIAASAGNHAQAVAYHGARLGIPVTIVMPTATPTIKVEQTEGHGATVVLEGKVFDDAYAHAQALADEKGYVFVHPFDDPDVIAGQGTVGLEMLAKVPDLDVLVVPIGGGGLMSGIAIAARAANPDIEIVGVEAAMFPAMKNILEGKTSVMGGDTLAEGIAVKEPGRITRAIIGKLVDRIELVEEAAIEHAVALLVGIEKTVVEGAGAAGLAHLLADPQAYAGKKVGTVLCGGNIDPHLLSNVLVRELVRAGRIARLKIEAEDRPGALAAITAKFQECRVNIIETNHHRVFTALPAKDTLIEVECEARDAAAIDGLIEALEGCGFKVRREAIV
ncbi:threonine ammonia-lyase [Sphingomicrobium astaxanthinifaciens]|uniref:threonine ammonia-lyase n=1 Tax=Sphingomicrobium astaxanthinifaciens TaxID=1227949 RepID=UPI001FCC20F7|nr:threonine ammonia-lyase [Sphingomicrobium astaxanthinifaciens]MCJ7421692.1 threonine ammonia-lyase [Sphingomicrobium astaxanthinifaciens]